MEKKKKSKKWIRFRHRVVRNIAFTVMYPFSKYKFGVTIEKNKEPKGRQYLILLNHQTTFDQFFVGMAFKGPIYYVATEDIFSNGWISSLIKYLVAPIPIKKQTTDVHAVMNCIRVVKEGGTIAIAPEGNRTYSGRTEYMNPAIVPLVKKLGLPLVLFRIEGGYGVQPRWSDSIRKGKMRAYVHQIVEPETYKQLSDQELFDLIKEGLYVNEGYLDSEFHGKNLAEYLERAIYVCPHCGLAEFESKGHEITCKKCNRSVKYLPTKELVGVGFDFPFRFVVDWYDYQCNFINNLNTEEYADKPLFRDKARFSSVIVYKKKVCLKKDAEIALYGNRIVIDEGKEDPTIFNFEETTAVSVLGRNKLNIYHDKKVYQLKGDKHFNALKYVNIFYRHKNIIKGDSDVKFLGL